MFEFVKLKINEKKILRNELRLSEELNQKLMDVNKEQQEKIEDLKSYLKVVEDAEDQNIIEICKLESNLTEKSKYIEELEKKSKEDNKTINEKNEIIESQDYTIEIYEDRNKQLLNHNEKLKKKSNRQEKRALKLKVELSESQNINNELIRKVTVSEIAKCQLKELCKYRDNNIKEIDKVKRPGVVVNKYVSGVKVYELANLM